MSLIFSKKITIQVSMTSIVIVPIFLGAKTYASYHCPEVSYPTHYSVCLVNIIPADLARSAEGLQVSSFQLNTSFWQIKSIRSKEPDGK